MTGFNNEPPPLTNTDIAILSTLGLQKKLNSGQELSPDDLQLVPRHMLRPIRPLIDPQSERMVASGPCRLVIWDAPGDGSYDAAGAPLLFTGTANSMGVAYGVGAAAGTVAMNLMGARRAKQDAVQRWMDYIPHGAATVSTHGFYVESQEHGLLHWQWELFSTAEWIEPSTVELTLQTDEGSVRCRFLSDWAELVFVSWVQVCHPQHPGKYTWFHQDWIERVRNITGIDPFTEQPVDELGG